MLSTTSLGLPRWLISEESACEKGVMGSVSELGDPLLWRRKWQPILVFLPGKSHGKCSLAGYSPWGCKSWTRLSNKTTTPLALVIGDSLLFYTCQGFEWLAGPCLGAFVMQRTLKRRVNVLGVLQSVRVSQHGVGRS